MPSKLTEEDIDELWRRMSGIYPNWVSQYGDSDRDGTWLWGLRDVTPDQLMIGIEKCRVSRDEWNPTLPFFRSRCLSQECSAPYHRPFPKALPTPPANRSIGFTALHAIRRMLGMKQLDTEDDLEAHEERVAMQEEGSV